MSALKKEISLPRLSKPQLRRSARSRRAPVATGLEISATHAIAARAHAQDGRIVADRVAHRTLSSGLVHDGVVIDPDALARELRSLFAGSRLTKRVRVGLATSRTVLRVIDLPPLDERDVRAALMIQAQDRIPMPLDKAVLDFQTVGLVDAPEGRRLRIIVVASEREGVERLLRAVRGAGLRPVGVDLSIFAIIRALRTPDAGAGPMLYAQLGDLANVAIAEAGVCRFTRVAQQGLTTLLERVRSEHGLDVDEAWTLLMDGGEGSGRSLHALLERSAVELGTELRTAAEFYATQFGTGTVSAGAVTGPLALIPGFVPAVADASGLELSCGEVAATKPEALHEVDRRLAALACGLSVGELA